MEILILLLGCATAAVWLPIQANLTAQWLNRECERKCYPDPRLYAILGALYGLMCGLGVIQADAGLYSLLIVPGIVLATVLVEVVIIAMVVVTVMALARITPALCGFFRMF